MRDTGEGDGSAAEELSEPADAGERHHLTVDDCGPGPLHVETLAEAVDVGDAPAEGPAQHLPGPLDLDIAGQGSELHPGQARWGCRWGTVPYEMDAGQIGRWLVVAAVVLAVAGGALLVGSRLGLGRLPGDLAFGRGGTRVYVPLATSLLVSIVATIVLNVLARRG